MNIRKTLFLLSLSALTAGSVFAQNTKQKPDTTIKGQTIQITQIYQPVIKQTVKPDLIPTLPPPDTTKPQFKYTVPQQTLRYTYHSIPIRPLALGKQPETSTYQNYIKAGLGNLTSVYLDAGIGSLNGKNYQTDFHISHLNQDGKLADQQSSYTIFNASGKYFTPKLIFSAQIGIRNRRNRFYGYNHALFQNGEGALKHTMTDEHLTLGFQNKTENKLHIDYHPEITVGMFGDNLSANEKKLGFAIPLSYRFGGDTATNSPDENVRGKVSLGFAGNFIRFKNAQFAAWNNLFRINPAFDLNVKNTTFHIGLSPAFGKDKTYLLPDVNVQTRLLNNHLKFSVGWQSDVQQNSYLDLSLINPFMNNIFAVRQSNTDRFFVSAHSTAGKFVTFGAAFSWKQWKDMPLFINNYALNPDGKRFQVIYDPKVEAFILNAFVRYQPSEVVGATLQGSWYNFYEYSFDAVWGYPNLRLTGDLFVKPVRKLHLKAGFTLLNGIEAQKAGGVTKKQAVIFDLNAAGEYNIIPRLSVFLQANNLLNKEYQRWYQYDVYGIHLIAGVRFKF